MKCKNLILLASMGFAALLSAVPFHAALAANAPDLRTAQSFAVLAGAAVTCTDSVVTGDVGVYPGSAVTVTRCTISGTVHPGDSVAEQAHIDFLSAYAALGTLPACNFTNFVPDNTSATLMPGVYCFDAAVTQTGTTWTLVGSATDTWIFRIGTGGTGALTGTNFSVVMTGGEACNNNVFWWTAEAATLTNSTFIGSILAGAAITVTGGSLDGQALAKAAVTLTGTKVSVCGNVVFPPFPPYPAIKVTGGGQIPVPNPDSAGRATFGFNAQPDKNGGAKGNLNYVDHVTGLHVNGPVTSIQVTAVNSDGSPKTVLFSGTWEGGSFFVTVEDHAEPGTSDQFGITLTTGTGKAIKVIEVVSQRVISNGNIQFHGK